MPQDNEKSPHILNTSATLLGICFIVLTSLNMMKVTDRTIMDELTTVAMMMFMLSSLFSFLSMRNSRMAAKYEKIADIVFFTGLVFLFIITMLLAFNIIK